MSTWPNYPSPARSWRDWFSGFSGHKVPARAAALDDLLYAAGRTMSLERLLVSIPQQLCAALQLDCFFLFTREGSDFVLRGSPPEADALSFRASSAVLVQLRRDRNLLSLDERLGNAWLVLVKDQELQPLRQLGAQWLIALPGRTGLAGFAALGRRSKTDFTRGETRLLRDLASRIGVGLEAVEFQQTLQTQAAEQERAARRLELARAVQERMLPESLPFAPGLLAAAMYQSMEEVGGDYYDAFWTPAGQLCYVIADVSGKGVAAALLMSTLRAALRTAMLTTPELPKLLSLLNKQLLEASAPSHYATLAILLYDPESRMLTSCNAGHNPPILLVGDAVRQLSLGGPVLGLLTDVVYAQEALKLASGDVILLFTDGLVERTNAAEEEWGESRLIQAARAARAERGAQAMMRAITQALASYAGQAVQADDTTLVVLRAE